MEQTSGERQALLPAAREGAGQLLAPAAQAEFIEGSIDGLLALAHAEHARHEIEVLADRKVVPQGELLGHVAHLALDRGAFPEDVESEAGAATAIRRQQAAEHADRGRLAAAVGAEEAVNLALADLQAQILDHVLVAEAFVDAGDVDDQAVHRPPRRTSTGSPGRRRAACSGAGTASTRKTSFSRLPRL